MREGLPFGILGVIILLVGIIGFIFLNRKLNDGKERNKVLTTYMKIFRMFAKGYIFIGAFCILLMLMIILIK